LERNVRLVYIGEQYPAELPGFVKQFQEKETGKQFDWVELSEMMCQGPVTERPATEEEMRSAYSGACLISACLTFLQQFTDNEYAVPGDVGAAAEAGVEA
jgi:hypothetical protein